MELFWENLRQKFGYNDILLNITGMFLVANGVFWLVNFFLLYVDLTGKPAWLLRYKIQADQNVPVDRSRLPGVFKRVLFNSLVVGTGLSVVFCVIQHHIGCPTSGQELPNLWQIVKEFAVFTIVEEIGFYYGHRFFHYGQMYKKYHKIHHEWTAPIGIVSVYCHPLEHIVANVTPLLLGPTLVRSHMVTGWLWLAVAVTTTSIHHSGYHLPFLASPEFHDYHHLKFNQNYGVLGFLDWLHGTDEQFRRSVQHRRDKTLLSFTPMSTLIPEREKLKR